jgi:hypothetical protein
MQRDTSERHESLWWVATPPGVWAAHFLSCYATAAVWCAKQAEPGASLLVARAAIGGYTALALVALGVVARRGRRRQGSLPRSIDDDEQLDSPEVRQHFLGFTLLALSALSAIAVVFSALAAVFIGSCR